MTSEIPMLKEDQHLQTLSKHKGIYDLYVKTGEIVNFHSHVRKEVVDAYKVHDPHYHYNDACSVCIAEMLVTIYRWYNTQI